MTTLNTQLQHVCAGGNHLRIALTVDALPSRIVNCDLNDITEQITEEDLEAFTKLLLRLYSRGKTKVQIKNGLQTGFQVTL